MGGALTVLYGNYKVHTHIINFMLSTSCPIYRIVGNFRGKIFAVYIKK